MTVDRPIEGLAIAQPRRGFRYGSEAFWLVGFALEGGWPDAALDLGDPASWTALWLSFATATAVALALPLDVSPATSTTLDHYALASLD